MVREDGRYCDGCGQRLPPKAMLGQQKMPPQEAREYGVETPPDTDGTVTIDFCLACRIQRAERLKGR